MVNATAMNVSEGWKYLTNTTDLNIVKASIEGWKHASGGIAGFILFSSMILLVSFMLFSRGLKGSAIAAGTLLMTYVVDYYKLLDYVVDGYEFFGYTIYHFIYLICIVVIAGEIIYDIWFKA